VSSTLLEKKVTINDILTMKAGDVIPIEMPEKITVRAGGLPSFRATYGVSNDRAALKVTDIIDRTHILAGIGETNG
jgi:flagellar motor switch protein FliM